MTQALQKELSCNSSGRSLLDQMTQKKQLSKSVRDWPQQAPTSLPGQELASTFTSSPSEPSRICSAVKKLKIQSYTGDKGRKSSPRLTLPQTPVPLQQWKKRHFRDLCAIQGSNQQPVLTVKINALSFQTAPLNTQFANNMQSSVLGSLLSQVQEHRRSEGSRTPCLLPKV